MKKHWAVLLLMVLAGAFACAPTTSTQTTQERQLPSLQESGTATLTATVQAVDLKKRTVTLKGSEGNVFTIKVDDSVKNLPQVKVGDQVVAQYYEAIAVEVMKPGEAPGGASAKEAVATAKPGEKPAGVVVSTVTVTTTIENINKKDQTVTLKGPQGNTEVVKVRNPQNLEKVKVGDEVVITYTQALAISVEKP
jgi:hypothetical protein